MSTNGYSVPIDGHPIAAFPGSKPPASVTLDTGAYVIAVSFCDVNSPGLLVLTAPDGTMREYDFHGAYPFPQPFAPNGIFTVTSCSNVDQVTILRPRSSGAIPSLSQL